MGAGIFCVSILLGFVLVSVFGGGSAEEVATTTSLVPTTTTTTAPTTTVATAPTTAPPPFRVSTLEGAWRSPDGAATALGVGDDVWEAFGFRASLPDGREVNFVLTEPMQISGLPTPEVYAASVAMGSATVDGSVQTAKALLSFAPTDRNEIIVRGELFLHDGQLDFEFLLKRP